MNRLFRISSPVGIPDLAGWPAYLAAIALAIAAAGTKELLLRIADTDAVFTTYFPAIAVAAWLGGFRAGLVATLASAAIDDLRFVDAGGSIIPVALPDQIRVVLFMVGGMLIAGLSGRLRGAARALAEQRVEVARSSDQLQVVLAAVTDAITVQRNDGQLLYANDAAAKLLGFASATELIAAPIGYIIGRSQVMDEEGGPFPLEHLPGRRALAGERTEPVLVRFRVRATGEERWSEVQAVPVFEADGRVRFAVNLFRDVTIERRRRAADRFLADATAVLAGRLDEKHALEELAQLAIQRLADWCVIDVIGPDGVTIESAIAHADPEPVEFGRRYRDLRPLHRDAVGGAAEVMRTGEPRWMPEITDRQVEEALAGTELADEVLGLGLRSYVCAPLMSRGRPIGAISMFAAESGRTYDEHDLAVAVELGERAGVALEHARIYRAADARRSELTAVLSAMREAVLVYDPDGHLVLRNPAAEALLAPDPPARLEQLARALDLDGDRPLAWSEMWDRPPLEIRRRDGSWLEVSTYRAVASTSEAESESRRERRTRRRGSTILVVRDVTASRAAQAAREAFMGLLSHELRTPITTIYGGTRLLERPLADEARQEIVSDVRSEAERLYRLVEDLLVMTRVERGGVEIGDEPILLQRVLNSVAVVEQGRWPGLQVKLGLPPTLPAVRGDPTYVEQIVRNLLTNAAKYGGVSDPVEIVAIDDGEDVAVRVLDRGPGIDADDADHLFDLFYRGASTARTASGAGIGLFVCRALVTAMGGRMWAAPREGGGAEFGFSLPVFASDDDL